MTESEAKTKWCPMVLTPYFTGETSISRDEDDKQASACITRECMMWQWLTTPETAATAQREGDATRVPTGFCGLARR